MKLRTLLLILSIAIFQKVAFAQSPKAESKKRSPELLAAACKASTDVCTKLSAGKTEEVATWIANEIGYTRDPANKMTLKGDWRAGGHAGALHPGQDVPSNRARPLVKRRFA